MPMEDEDLNDRIDDADDADLLNHADQVQDTIKE